MYRGVKNEINIAERKISSEFQLAFGGSQIFGILPNIRHCRSRNFSTSLVESQPNRRQMLADGHWDPLQYHIAQCVVHLLWQLLCVTFSVGTAWPSSQSSWRNLQTTGLCWDWNATCTCFDSERPELYDAPPKIWVSWQTHKIWSVVADQHLGIRTKSRESLKSS